MTQDVNVIILDPFEEFVTWLNSDKVEITETNKTQTQRTINIEYPIEDIDQVTINNWFNIGNKIYVPEGLGITSCLYVINTEYTLDYWDKNIITIEAEEVLTELNNVLFDYIKEDSLKINKTNLESWFGAWYDIDQVDTISSSKNTILPAGSSTLLTFLRDIEDTTELIFKTEYSHEHNKITRKLSLVDPDTAGIDYQNSFLDLNYNMESLEVNVDESDTYTAMAPLFSLNESSTTSEDTSTTGSNTSSTGTTRADLETTMTTWKNLSVEYREKIPMIVEKQSDGSIKYTSYWYSPFKKEEGKMYIENTVGTATTYNCLVPYKSVDEIPKVTPVPKIGTASTSETEKYAIFNVLANKLLDKTSPQYTIKISIKDIQAVLGDNNLGYQLYDHLYVRIPGFSYYIQATITETKKNPHLAGENTITLETDVSSTSLIEDTEITSTNQVLSATETVATIGGAVITEDSGVPNELVTINVSLTDAYTYKSGSNTETRKNSTGTTGTIQAVITFYPQDGAHNYIFTNAEIENMAKIIKNYIINNGATPKSVNMRAVDGAIYKVSYMWCRAIYYSRNQWFCNLDTAPHGTDDSKKGQYSATIQVLWRSDTTEFQKYLEKGYLNTFPQFFYQRISSTKTEIYNKYYKSKDPTHTVTQDPVSSTDIQTGGTCFAVSTANSLERLWDWKTEAEAVSLCHTDIEEGTYPTDWLKYVPKGGYVAKYVKATWSNLVKYVNDPRYEVIIAVNLKYFSYYSSITEDAYHAIHVTQAFSVKNGGKYVILEDSNWRLFYPPNGDDTTYLGLTLAWSEVYDASYTGYSSYWKQLVDVTSKPAPDYNVIYVIGLTSKRKSSGVTIHGDPGADLTFTPKTVNYYFNTDTIIKSIKNFVYEAKQKIYTYPILFSKKINVTDTKGRSWKMTADYLYCMYMAVICSYKDTPTAKKSNQVLTVNNDSNTLWYYNKNNTDYNWFGYIAPHTDMVSKYGWNRIAVATILSMLWKFVMPADLPNSMAADDAPSITDFVAFFEDYDDLNVFTVDLTADNIAKYCTSYIHTVGVSIHMETEWIADYIYPANHRTYQIITEKDDNKIGVYNTGGRGNYPNENNDTAYSNSPLYNPWRYFSSVNFLQGDLAESDSWYKKMVVISIYTQSELEEGLS